VEDVWTGQELARPLRALPARWFVENVLVRIARSISSSVQVRPRRRGRYGQIRADATGHHQIPQYTATYGWALMSQVWQHATGRNLEKVQVCIAYNP
jgi:hypothetical protein